MKKIVFLLSCFLSIAFIELHAQSCSSRRYIDEIFASQVTSDVLYGNADPYGLLTSQDLRLDIYEPAGDSIAKRPLIIYAFGGAFLIGDKSQPDVPTFCSHFAKQGFVVASINYRIGFNTLSSGSAIRAVYRALQDVKAATRFMCENRDVYKIDTNYILYSGSSAGCITGLENAFLTESDRPSATYAGVELLEPDDLGCSECSGNTLFSGRTPRPAGIISRWGAVLDTNDIGSSAYDSVPVISFHGTADNAVPFEYGTPFSYPVFPTVYGSASIHQRLSHLNIYNQLVPLQGAGHEPQLLNMDWDDTIFKYTTPFVLKILQPKTSNISGPGSVCISDTVVFSVTDHASSSFCWDFDSACTLVSETHNSIRVVLSTLGVHTISVMELNAIHCSGDAVSHFVNVVPKPLAAFRDSVFHDVLYLVNTSSGAASSDWHFGDGNTSLSPSPTHTYSDSGFYLVSLSVFNGACADDSSKWIYIDKCPHAAFSYSVFYNQVFLNNSSTYAQHYDWDFGDGAHATNSNPSHVYAADGEYTIRLIVDNGHQCFDTLEQLISTKANAIDVLKSSTKFVISPNPMQDHFLIRALFDEAQGVAIDYTLYDVRGVLVQQAEKLQLPANVYVEHLLAGVYFLKLFSKEGSVMMRVVVE